MSGGNLVRFSLKSLCPLILILTVNCDSTQGHPTEHDYSGLSFGNFPGGVWAEEWWGLFTTQLDPPDRPAGVCALCLWCLPVRDAILYHRFQSLSPDALETPWCDEWQVPYTDKMLPRGSALTYGQLNTPYEPPEE